MGAGLNSSKKSPCETQSSHGCCVTDGMAFKRNGERRSQMHVPLAIHEEGRLPHGDASTLTPALPLCYQYWGLKQKLVSIWLSNANISPCQAADKESPLTVNEGNWHSLKTCSEKRESISKSALKWNISATWKNRKVCEVHVSKHLQLPLKKLCKN